MFFENESRHLKPTSQRDVSLHSLCVVHVATFGRRMYVRTMERISHNDEVGKYEVYNNVHVYISYMMCE